MFDWTKLRYLAYGFLLGTAGVKLMATPEAKKACTHVTAAALRGVDEVTKTATVLKENCDDIVAEAKLLNERRAAAACVTEIADTAAGN